MRIRIEGNRGEGKTIFSMFLFQAFELLGFDVKYEGMNEYQTEDFLKLSKATRFNTLFDWVKHHSSSFIIDDTYKGDK